jgi:DNA topoisomerase-3
VLSIGRVQTPTLALIVRRQKEIDNFIPEQYWILSTNYRDIIFTASKGKISTYEEGKEALAKVCDLPFVVTEVSSKKGTEIPPRLYDLTSLQVDCNKKFGYSADLTLQLIQSLYEKKFTTYPRVDTTYLSDDIYPKCPNILLGLKGYEQFTNVLQGKKLLKSKKFFDSSKVTDHHAIIPTGIPAYGLSDMERNVYDLIAKSFIAIFYPDCKFLTTTVLGTVGDVDFKTTGKQITDLGWRIIYKKDIHPSVDVSSENSEESNEDKVLPQFVVGESGPHEPALADKWTSPPKPYTEATLLRAMETAGKLVDNEELRDALKENGIGRPSTRAAIIETLFKRRYIRKERKNLIATPTGIELIDIIQDEMLKSAELTGVWEKKLREIEKGKYDTKQFLDELKQMVAGIVDSVRQDSANHYVAVTTEEDLKKTKRKSVKTEKDIAAGDTRQVAGFQPRSKRKPTNHNANNIAVDEWVGLPCPICHEGHIVKGHTAYGCSRWKEGCTYRRALSDGGNEKNI